jgi:hypothetical protein
MTPAYVVCHELSAWDGELLGALLQRVTSAGAQVFVGGLERILEALADRYRHRQGPLACQELAVMSAGRGAGQGGSAAFEGETAGRQGWLAEPAPDRFTLTAGVSQPGGGS